LCIGLKPQIDNMDNFAKQQIKTTYT
jgi:hypothetical protein